MQKFLGKIDSVMLGSGGYDGAMFGFTFGLRFDGSCCTSRFWGTWSAAPSPSAKWTVAEQQGIFLKSLLDVKKLMEDAKVDDFTKLAGKPIEVTVEGGVMGQVTDWRILTEVL